MWVPIFMLSRDVDILSYRLVMDEDTLLSVKQTKFLVALHEHVKSFGTLGSELKRSYSAGLFVLGWKEGGEI